MASATKTASKRGGDGATLLKGSMLPKSVNKITVFVHGAREAPEEWKSPFVLDIDEIHGAAAMALNKTNVKRMVALCGDDFEKWGGYDLTLIKVRTNNPTTGAAAWGLEIDGAKKSKRKPKPATGDIPF